MASGITIKDGKETYNINYDQSQAVSIALENPYKVYVDDHIGTADEEVPDDIVFDDRSYLIVVYETQTSNQTIPLFNVDTFNNCRPQLPDKIRVGGQWLSAPAEYTFKNPGNHKLILKWYSHTTLESLFCGNPYIKLADFHKLNPVTITSMRAMFMGCENFRRIYYTYMLVFQKVTTTAYMFMGCKSFDGYHQIVFNMPKLRSCAYMFANAGVTTLDVSECYAPIVTDFTGMFYGCTSVTKILMGTSDSVKDHVITYTGICPSAYLQDKVTFEGMFYGCTKLEFLDMTNLITSRVNNIRFMFYDCKSLNWVRCTLFLFSLCLRKSVSWKNNPYYKCMPPNNAIKVVLVHVTNYQHNIFASMMGNQKNTYYVNELEINNIPFNNGSIYQPDLFYEKPYTFKVDYTK